VRYRLREDLVVPLDFDFQDVPEGDSRTSSMGLIRIEYASRSAKAFRYKYVVDGVALGSEYEVDELGYHRPVLTLRKGFSWDGATWFPDHWAMKASAVHDAFYTLMREKVLDDNCRPHADRAFFRLYTGPKLLAWLAWFGLKLFGRRALRHPRKIREV